MTWLRGTTTWANIVDDLAKLACGEIADDTATTCATGDRWVRDISTSFNLIRSPTSEDVNTGSVNFRAGYLTLLTAGKVTSGPNALTHIKSVCRQTSLWSGVPTGLNAANKWMMMVKVTTANSVGSNYSTARLSLALYDLEGNIHIGFETTGAAPNSAGVYTWTAGTKTITIEVSDPSGVLTNGAVWFRGFTATYLGGIDYHGGMFHRRSGAATYSVNPPGTVTTDYVLEVEEGSAFTGIVESSSGDFNTWAAFGMLDLWPPSGPLAGVGLKTVTALTGAQYTCSWNMAFIKMRMVAGSGASNGSIDLECFGSGVDVSGTYRRIGGFKIFTWMQPYVTPGSVTNGSAIQYWMSVKPNKIIVVLNADSGQTGTLTTGGIYPFTTYNYGGYDKFPIAVSRTVQNSTISNGLAAQQHHNFNLIQQMIRQDGSEGRDWQTGWGRCDGLLLTGISPLRDGDTFGYTSPDSTTSQAGVVGTGYSGHAPPLITIPLVENAVSPSGGYPGEFHPYQSTKPNAISGKWQLFGFPCPDIMYNHFRNAPGVSGAGNVIYEASWARGYMAADVTSPFLFIPGGSWSSGDEITDTVSGAKFFLVNPIYAGLLAFFTTGNGGVAILEE